MSVFRYYSGCGGEYINESLPMSGGFFVRYTYDIISAYPSWFNVVEGTNPPLGNTVIGWNFTFPDNITDEAITIQRTTWTPFYHYDDFMTIEIVTDLSCGLEEYDVCCTDACNIAWLTRQGGWQNYIFPGVKEWRVEVGDAKTFKTNQPIIKYSEVRDVYNGKICSTGDIPKSHVDLLDSLQYAIQAYMWNADTENWDIPILIDKKSFVKYKTRDKFYDVKIRFIYAEELLVQTQ